MFLCLVIITCCCLILQRRIFSLIHFLVIQNPIKISQSFHLVLSFLTLFCSFHTHEHATRCTRTRIRIFDETRGLFPHFNSTRGSICLNWHRLLLVARRFSHFYSKAYLYVIRYAVNCFFNRLCDELNQCSQTVPYTESGLMDIWNSTCQTFNAFRFFVN